MDQVLVPTGTTRAIYAQWGGFIIVLKCDHDVRSHQLEFRVSLVLLRHNELLVADPFSFLPVYGLYAAD